MKQSFILFILSFLLLIGACKKESVIEEIPSPIPEKQYMIRKLLNNALNREYTYTNTKLLKITYYNSGEVIKTTEFVYEDSIMTQSVTIYNNTGWEQIKYFTYNENNQLTKINWAEDSSHNIKIIVEYKNNEMYKIKWYRIDTPFYGFYFPNANKDVNYYEYYLWSNTPVGSGNGQQKNHFTFDDKTNPINRFWMVETNYESLSKHNPILQTQTTETYIDWGGGTGGEWYSSKNNWKYEYQYNSEGFPTFQTKFDSNNVPIYTYQFEYLDL